MNGVTCIGINHHGAPIEVREKVAFTPAQIPVALQQLMSHKHIDEAAILSTCNRVEIYAHSDAGEIGEALEGFLHEFHTLPLGFLSPHLYSFTGNQALVQLFRVASSLDSQIIGEPQILGQVKQAYATAKEFGTTGPTLNRVFHRAFSTAKRIRHETQIGHNAISVAYAAVELARKIFGSLSGKNCVLIGAGDTAELVAQYCKRQGAHITIANRTLERARVLATRFDAKAVLFEQTHQLLEKADVVIASAGGAEPIISHESLQRLMPARRYRPLFLVDIAVPRNIDPMCGSIDGIYLYNIDDLKQAVSQNLVQRQLKALKAEDILQEEIISLERKLCEQQLAPALEQICTRSRQIAHEEATKIIGDLGPGLSEGQKDKIFQMAQNIASRSVHWPMMELKEWVHNNPSPASGTRAL